MASSTYSLTSTSGISIPGGGSPEPRTPRGLIVTRAVELKDGWVGQVLVAESVVQEKGDFETGQDAEEWATGWVIAAVKKLLK